MSRRKYSPLPFDKIGGRVVIQRRLLVSDAYLKLPAQAKALISLMQVHWRNDKYVAYGVREAAVKIPCDRKTAMKAFDSLVAAGFIAEEGGFYFDNRQQRKSRSWRLTWLPFDYGAPTNDWEGH